MGDVATEPFGNPTWRNIHTHPTDDSVIEVQAPDGRILRLRASAGLDWSRYTGWRPIVGRG